MFNSQQTSRIEFLISYLAVSVKLTISELQMLMIQYPF